MKLAKKQKKFVLLGGALVGIIGGISALTLAIPQINSKLIADKNKLNFSSYQDLILNKYQLDEFETYFKKLNETKEGGLEHGIYQRINEFVANVADNKNQIRNEIAYKTMIKYNLRLPEEDKEAENDEFKLDKITQSVLHDLVYQHQRSLLKEAKISSFHKYNTELEKSFIMTQAKLKHLIKLGINNEYLLDKAYISSGTLAERKKTTKEVVKQQLQHLLDNEDLFLQVYSEFAKMPIFVPIFNYFLDLLNHDNNLAKNLLNFSPEFSQFLQETYNRKEKTFLENTLFDSLKNHVFLRLLNNFFSNKNANPRRFFKSLNSLIGNKKVFNFFNEAFSKNGDLIKKFDAYCKSKNLSADTLKDNFGKTMGNAIKELIKKSNVLKETEITKVAKDDVLLALKYQDFIEDLEKYYDNEITIIDTNFKISSFSLVAKELRYNGTKEFKSKIANNQEYIYKDDTEVTLIDNVPLDNLVDSEYLDEKHTIDFNNFITKVLKQNQLIKLYYDAELQGFTDANKSVLINLPESTFARFKSKSTKLDLKYFQGITQNFSLSDFADSDYTDFDAFNKSLKIPQQSTRVNMQLFNTGVTYDYILQNTENLNHFDDENFLNSAEIDKSLYDTRNPSRIIASELEDMNDSVNAFGYSYNDDDYKLRSLGLSTINSPQPQQFMSTDGYVNFGEIINLMYDNFGKYPVAKMYHLPNTSYYVYVFANKATLVLDVPFDVYQKIHIRTKTKVPFIKVKEYDTAGNLITKEYGDDIWYQWRVLDFMNFYATAFHYNTLSNPYTNDEGKKRQKNFFDSFLATVFNYQNVNNQSEIVNRQNNQWTISFITNNNFELAKKTHNIFKNTKVNYQRRDPIIYPSYASDKNIIEANNLSALLSDAKDLSLIYSINNFQNDNLKFENNSEVEYNSALWNIFESEETPQLQNFGTSEQLRFFGKSLYTSYTKEELKAKFEKGEITFSNTMYDKLRFSQSIRARQHYMDKKANKLTFYSIIDDTNKAPEIVIPANVLQDRRKYTKTDVEYDIFVDYETINGNPLSLSDVYHKHASDYNDSIYPDRYYPKLWKVEHSLASDNIPNATSLYKYVIKSIDDKYRLTIYSDKIINNGKIFYLEVPRRKKYINDYALINIGNLNLSGNTFAYYKNNTYHKLFIQKLHFLESSRLDINDSSIVGANSNDFSPFNSDMWIENMWDRIEALHYKSLYRDKQNVFAGFANDSYWRTMHNPNNPLYNFYSKLKTYYHDKTQENFEAFLSEYNKTRVLINQKLTSGSETEKKRFRWDYTGTPIDRWGKWNDNLYGYINNPLDFIFNSPIISETYNGLFAKNTDMFWYSNETANYYYSGFISSNEYLYNILRNNNGYDKANVFNTSKVSSYVSPNTINDTDKKLHDFHKGARQFMYDFSREAQIREINYNITSFDDFISFIRNNYGRSINDVVFEDIKKITQLTSEYFNVIYDRNDWVFDEDEQLEDYINGRFDEIIANARLKHERISDIINEISLKMEDLLNEEDMFYNETFKEFVKNHILGKTLGKWYDYYQSLPDKKDNKFMFYNNNAYEITQLKITNANGLKIASSKFNEYIKNNNLKSLTKQLLWEFYDMLQRGNYDNLLTWMNDNLANYRTTYHERTPDTYREFIFALENIFINAKQSIGNNALFSVEMQLIPTKVVDLSDPSFYSGDKQLYDSYDNFSYNIRRFVREFNDNLEIYSQVEHFLSWDGKNYINPVDLEMKKNQKYQEWLRRFFPDAYQKGALQRVEDLSSLYSHRAYLDYKKLLYDTPEFDSDHDFRQRIAVMHAEIEKIVAKNREFFKKIQARKDDFKHLKYVKSTQLEKFKSALDTYDTAKIAKFKEILNEVMSEYNYSSSQKSAVMNFFNTQSYQRNHLQVKLQRFDITDASVLEAYNKLQEHIELLENHKYHEALSAIDDSKFNEYYNKVSTYFNNDDLIWQVTKDNLKQSTFYDKQVFYRNTTNNFSYNKTYTPYSSRTNKEYLLVDVDGYTTSVNIKNIPDRFKQQLDYVSVENNTLINRSTDKRFSLNEYYNLFKDNGNQSIMNQIAYNSTTWDDEDEQLEDYMVGNAKEALENMVYNYLLLTQIWTNTGDHFATDYNSLISNNGPINFAEITTPRKAYHYYDIESVKKMLIKFEEEMRKKQPYRGDYSEASFDEIGDINYDVWQDVFKKVQPYWVEDNSIGGYFAKIVPNMFKQKFTHQFLRDLIVNQEVSYYKATSVDIKLFNYNGYKVNDVFSIKNELNSNYVRPLNIDSYSSESDFINEFKRILNTSNLYLVERNLANDETRIDDNNKLVYRKEGQYDKILLWGRHPIPSESSSKQTQYEKYFKKQAPTYSYDSYDYRTYDEVNTRALSDKADLQNSNSIIWQFNGTTTAVANNSTASSSSLEYVVNTSLQTNIATSLTTNVKNSDPELMKLIEKIKQNVKDYGFNNEVFSGSLEATLNEANIVSNINTVSVNDEILYPKQTIKKIGIDEFNNSLFTRPEYFIDEVITTIGNQKQFNVRNVSNISPLISDEYVGQAFLSHYDKANLPSALNDNEKNALIKQGVYSVDWNHFKNLNITLVDKFAKRVYQNDYDTINGQNGLVVNFDEDFLYAFDSVYYFKTYNRDKLLDNTTWFKTFFKDLQNKLKEYNQQTTGRLIYDTKRIFISDIILVGHNNKQKMLSFKINLIKNNRTTNEDDFNIYYLLNNQLEIINQYQNKWGVIITNQQMLINNTWEQFLTKIKRVDEDYDEFDYDIYKKLYLIFRFRLNPYDFNSLFLEDSFNNINGTSKFLYQFNYAIDVNNDTSDLINNHIQVNNTPQIVNMQSGKLQSFLANKLSYESIFKRIYGISPDKLSELYSINLDNNWDMSELVKLTKVETKHVSWKEIIESYNLNNEGKSHNEFLNDLFDENFLIIPYDLKLNTPFGYNSHYEKFNYQDDISKGSWNLKDILNYAINGAIDDFVLTYKKIPLSVIANANMSYRFSYHSQLYGDIPIVIKKTASVENDEINNKYQIYIGNNSINNEIINALDIDFVKLDYLYSNNYFTKDENGNIVNKQKDPRAYNLVLSASEVDVALDNDEQIINENKTKKRDLNLSVKLATDEEFTKNFKLYGGSNRNFYKDKITPEGIDLSAYETALPSVEFQWYEHVWKTNKVNEEEIASNPYKQYKSGYYQLEIDDAQITNVLTRDLTNVDYNDSDKASLLGINTHKFANNLTTYHKIENYLDKFMHYAIALKSQFHENEVVLASDINVAESVSYFNALYAKLNYENNTFLDKIILSQIKLILKFLSHYQQLLVYKDDLKTLRVQNEYYAYYETFSKIINTYDKLKINYASVVNSFELNFNNKFQLNDVDINAQKAIIDNGILKYILNENVESEYNFTFNLNSEYNSISNKEALELLKTLYYRLDNQMHNYNFSGNYSKYNTSSPLLIKLFNQNSTYAYNIKKLLYHAFYNDYTSEQSYNFLMQIIYWQKYQNILENSSIYPNLVFIMPFSHLTYGRNNQLVFNTYFSKVNYNVPLTLARYDELSDVALSRLDIYNQTRGIVRFNKYIHPKLYYNNDWFNSPLEEFKDLVTQYITTEASTRNSLWNELEIRQQNEADYSFRDFMEDFSNFHLDLGAYNSVYTFVKNQKMYRDLKMIYENILELKVYLSGNYDVDIYKFLLKNKDAYVYDTHESGVKALSLSKLQKLYDTLMRHKVAKRRLYEILDNWKDLKAEFSANKQRIVNTGKFQNKPALISNTHLELNFNVANFLDANTINNGNEFRSLSPLFQYKQLALYEATKAMKRESLQVKTRAFPIWETKYFSGYYGSDNVIEPIVALEKMEQEQIWKPQYLNLNRTAASSYPIHGYVPQFLIDAYTHSGGDKKRIYQEIEDNLEAMKTKLIQISKQLVTSLRKADPRFTYDDKLEIGKSSRVATFKTKSNIYLLGDEATLDTPKKLKDSKYNLLNTYERKLFSNHDLLIRDYLEYWLTMYQDLREVGFEAGRKEASRWWYNKWAHELYTPLIATPEQTGRGLTTNFIHSITAQNQIMKNATNFLILALSPQRTVSLNYRNDNFVLVEHENNILRADSADKLRQWQERLNYEKSNDKIRSNVKYITKIKEQDNKWGWDYNPTWNEGRLWQTENLKAVLLYSIYETYFKANKTKNVANNKFYSVNGDYASNSSNFWSFNFLKDWYEESDIVLNTVSLKMDLTQTFNINQDLARIKWQDRNYDSLASELWVKKIITFVNNGLLIGAVVDFIQEKINKNKYGITDWERIHEAEKLLREDPESWLNKLD